MSIYTPVMSYSRTLLLLQRPQLLCRPFSSLTTSASSTSNKISTSTDRDSQCRCISSSSVSFSSQSPNKDYVVNPVYHNRNPRNLEKLALARKRVGWKLTAPRKDY